MRDGNAIALKIIWILLFKTNTAARGHRRVLGVDASNRKFEHWLPSPAAAAALDWYFEDLEFGILSASSAAEFF
jgi:hypothetical protein